MALNNELLLEFIQEAQAHVVTIEDGLLCMETNSCDDDTINKVFRAVHSIKGTAGFFELAKIVELSHAMENLFSALRDHNLETSTDMVDVLLAATDILKEMVSRPESSGEEDISAHVAAVKAFLQAPPKEKAVKKPAAAPPPQEEPSAWDLWNSLTEGSAKPEEPPKTAAANEAGADAFSADELAALFGDDTPAAAAPPAAVKPPEPTAVQQKEAAPPSVAKPAVVEIPAKKSESKQSESIRDESIRVNVGLLNDLLNIVGEMVLRRNQLLRIAQYAGKDIPNLDVIAQGIDGLTTSLQEKVMKTRMQPVANVFNKFPRIVRELSRKLQKEVELVMEGLDVELDRSIIEALTDPLTHLIRNALDHGVEPSVERQKKNKPAVGMLKLHAYHESGRVIIDICDDGAGINIEKVRSKAVSKGWISEKEGQALYDGDLLAFIMRPGFSTSDNVTDISGRGVGMDVVKTNIEKLGGKIEILTEFGAGTTFRLILPLTLAIISAFIVEAEGEAVAIPQANVKELTLVQPEGKSGKGIEFIHSTPVLRLRNQLLPLIRLSEVLSVSTQDSSIRERNYEYFSNSSNTFRILVIKSGNMRYGLAVDAVSDTEEILVKPVPEVLNTGGFYSGVTILGDGRIAMIIDSENLRSKAGLQIVDESALMPEIAAQPKNAAGEEQYLLLFTCTGEEMLGIDLSMVSRIEEIPASKIQRVGPKQYLSFQGQTIRVIRPEHYLPITKRKSHAERLYVILPKRKLLKNPIGIIAEKIHDAILENIKLDENGVSGKGVIGSTQIGENIVTLINLYEVFDMAAPEIQLKAVEMTPVQAAEQAVVPQKEKKTTILLAEDTPFFAKLAQSYLEAAGYEVIVCENGRDALEKLLQTPTVDLVVSDIEMPVMNGLELVRAIRANASLKHLPAIALTSLASDKDKEKGMRAGFDLYEIKIDKGQLLESIDQILHK